MEILNVASWGSLYQGLLSRKPIEFNHLLTGVFPRYELKLNG